jgi:hypothetical protein
MTSRTSRRAAAFAAAFGTVAALGLMPAAAATTGQYAAWTVTGPPGAHTGSAATSIAGFPAVTLTSTAVAGTAPTGAATFLGAATPFGAVFGSSRNRPYLSVGTAAGLVASTTTLTFAEPTAAAGWGFALGDVDADAVEVSATGPGGSAVPVADLGWQDGFNYCAVAPKPASCIGTGPFTDTPTWDDITGTLSGQGLDTFGSAGWFEPTASVQTLTFTISRLAGTPTVQIWLAALSVPVTGTVAGVTPAAPLPSPGVVMDLEHSDGSPVTVGGAPVTAAADSSGDFVLPAVTDGSYVLHLDPPPGVVNAGRQNVRITVDTSTGGFRVPAGLFAVRVETVVAAPGTNPSRPSAPGPQLAATGRPVAPLVAAGLTLALLGTFVTLAGRRRRY